MSDTTDNLTSQLRVAEAEAAPLAASPNPSEPVSSRLNASGLLQIANRRRRKRLATRSLAVAGCAVLVCFGAMRFVMHNSDKQHGTVNLAKLTAEIDLLSQQTDALLAKLHSQEASLESSLVDTQLAALQAAIDEQELQALHAVVAVLEETTPASEDRAWERELAWEIEWSKSGALRLELARQDAERDPELATKKYRQIADTYAGTQWGDAARLALGGIDRL